MIARFLLLLLLTFWAGQATSQTLQDVLQANQSAVEKASRKTIDDVLGAIAAAELPEAPVFLERWQAKEVWMRKEDKLFFYVSTEDKETFTLTDISSGEVVGEAGKRDLRQLKPNSGVRSVIAVYLVQFQLSDPDINRRLAALDAIERDPDASHLGAIRGAIDNETNPILRLRKERLERLLTVRFGEDEADRVAAIESFSDDLSVDARAALNPLVTTRVAYTPGLPEDANVAGTVTPGSAELSVDAAYALMIDAGVALPVPTPEERKAALVANIADGQVGGIAVSELGSQEARDRAYVALVAAGTVPEWSPDTDPAALVSDASFSAVYTEPSAAVTTAAEQALSSIGSRVAVNRGFDLALDALSLGSIYFLAAIGLAITFGVMRVINMAHGEFIMMGAYTGYVVQLYISNYTLSLVVAVPLAFAVTFAAGVAMERSVIRWLYNRPLETLLATFGISIALQQLAKNIFGTQARPLTAPGWLDGAWVINDVVSISYIRIAIFVLALLFFALLLYILNRTRLGLEVRAVTQNPRMAASMGINPDRINMLTFGLGSGIAGIAGVAIGLYAKVTSELGTEYIVQSFMTVVVGGVGNIWGTLLGASLIGSLQKGIEFLNPSNTLAAQTYMILFIILFIQFRPRGIIALKGRAAGD
ncbi:MAG: urea ABC transporter permease subunit UrtB [Pseudomonadota bacterium]